jgi:hypothetical protein
MTKTGKLPCVKAESNSESGGDEGELEGKQEGGEILTLLCLSGESCMAGLKLPRSIEIATRLEQEDSWGWVWELQPTQALPDSCFVSVKKESLPGVEPRQASNV